MTAFLVPAPPPGAAPLPASTGPVTMSAYLPAYQVAPYIGESVGSLLAQTRPPLDIVVVDDGSTDDLEGALAPYRDRITLIHQPNRGAATAMNVGWRATRGEFAVLLDPDDRFLPGRFEAMAELAAARPDLDVLTTDALIEIDDVVTGRYYTATNRFETGDQRTGILRANFVFGHPAIRRTALEAVGGFDETLGSTFDWECWIRLILAGSRVGLVDEALAVYRLRPGSLSSARPRMLRGRVATLSRTLDRSDLSVEERAVATGSLAFVQRNLDLAESQRALLEGAGDARRRALAIARDGAHPWSSRAKAALTVPAPKAAGALLRKRARNRSRDPKAIRAARE